MAKRKKNVSSDKSAAEPAVVKPAASSLPAVSIIIPLYNAAEFIGDCLESLLGQTFQDFEVIVVDDCSTDNSAAIVKGYVSKFKGRLKLTKTSSNSGGGSVPRNKGLFFCKGEYVFFVNAEDFILLTALETLYNVAKKNNADLVYSGAYYDLRQADDAYVQRDGKGEQAFREAREDKPSLSGMELNKSIQQVIYEGYFWSTWTRFIRREFLIRNEITFPELKIGGDYLWTLHICCRPKRFWRIPTPLYFRRSFAGKTTLPESQLSLAFVDWLKALKNLSSRLKVLKDNPAYCYEASKNYFKSGVVDKLIKAQGQLKVHELYSTLYGGKELSDPTLAFFFSAISDTTNDAKSLNTARTHDSTHPLISVIIPLYNAAEYIGECLESLLAQTFQAFELIIVDDCSTDSSCEIVESYIPKFGGRLKLYHMEENTGSGARPRNKGLYLSSGEYIYNMDNDDTLTRTALAELYTLAKEYDADVVYCEKFYEVNPDGTNRKIQCLQKGGTVDKPTLEDEDLKARVKSIIDDRYYVVPWLKLIRRNLLIDHEIIFPALKISDDNIWHQGLLFYAKRILRVPNIVYVYRLTETSIMRAKKTPQVRMNFWIDPILRGLKYLDKLMSGHEFFRENPYYRYLVLKKFISVRFIRILSSSRELTDDVVYETIKNEYGKYFGEHDVLISCLCTYICEQNKAMAETKKESHQIKGRFEDDKELILQQAAEIKRLQKKIDSMSLLINQSTCAISVVIPLYNAAEYVGECLESLLIQTFQDFEVIVVDDCSTDNSVEVVESYLPKFDGRLKLTKTEKNSGGGGYVPRNIGFKLAQGSYVYFVDADDFLLGSALEILYTTARNNAVDVVYMGTVYDLRNPNNVFVWKNSTTKGLPSKKLEGKEYDKFLHGLAFEKIFTYPWVYFVKRDFLLQNNITFPEIMKAGDFLWAVSVCCQTKKIFLLMKPLYFYNHYNVNSVSRMGSANISHSKWILAFTDFIKALNEMVGKIKFLNNNLDYAYGITDRYFITISKSIAETNKSMSDKEIYKTLYYDFINKSSGLMVPFFFSAINAKEKELKDMQAVVHKIKSFILARIDIKLLPAKGDFQIISISDDKADIQSPGWLNVGGIGYMIHSYAGKLEVVVKATMSGMFHLRLRGFEARDLKDKSKLIPYWIDYTKLVVNKKVFFDTLTPVWVKRPYAYEMNIKANEEIRIQAEWQPHLDERTDLSAKPAQIQKSDTSAKPAQTQEPDAPKSVVQIQENNSALLVIDKFKNYLTARVDLALTGVGAKNLQIVSVSDDKAAIKKPAWLQKDGVCYQIESYVGNMEIVAKAFAGGQLNLSLKGIWVPDPEDKSKRLRYWIDFTKCIVNGEVILDKITPVWNGKPYVYNKEVKAGEEIKINLEWLPHRGKA